MQEIKETLVQYWPLRQRGSRPPSSVQHQMHQILPCGRCFKTLPTVCHVTLFVIFAGSYFFNIYFNLHIKRSILADYIYLTHWNLTFQAFFTGFELLSDFVPTVAECTATFRAKFLYSFVSSFFWGLSLYDEDLVRDPPDLRPEEWYNHIVHSLVVPAAFVEVLILYHKLPAQLESATITLLLGGIYILWALAVGLTADIWAYEIIHKLPLRMLLVFLLVCSVAVLLFHQIGRFVHNKYWKR